MPNNTTSNESFSDKSGHRMKMYSDDNDVKSSKRKRHVY